MAPEEPLELIPPVDADADEPLLPDAEPAEEFVDVELVLLVVDVAPDPPPDVPVGTVS